MSLSVLYKRDCAEMCVGDEELHMCRCMLFACYQTVQGSMRAEIKNYGNETVRIRI